MRPTPLDHGEVDRIQRDGVAVPARYGAVVEELRALRRSVALSDLAHTGLVRVRGAAAWDVLDRLLPCDLFLRSGQARQTLLLDEDGTIAADVLVVCADQAYLLLTEGLETEALLDRVRAQLRPEDDASVEDLGAERTTIGVNGPFAWELLSELFSPGIAGMPYLTLADLEDDVLCVRAGKTGEYGYDLLVPRHSAAALWDRVREAGRHLALARAGVQALDHASLENWFYSVHEPGCRPLTPLHLQLQWRISRTKPYPGADALAALRRRGLERRVCGLRGPSGLEAGQALHHDGAPVGEVVAARDRWSGDGAFGLGLVDLALAHPGHQGLSVRRDGQWVPLRTVSPPFLANRSLFVRPQWHRYATRHDISFPEEP